MTEFTIILIILTFLILGLVGMIIGATIRLKVKKDSMEMDSKPSSDPIKADLPQ